MSPEIRTLVGLALILGGGLLLYFAFTGINLTGTGTFSSSSSGSNSQQGTTNSPPIKGPGYTGLAGPPGS